MTKLKNKFILIQYTLNNYDPTIYTKYLVFIKTNLN